MFSDELRIEIAQILSQCDEPDLTVRGIMLANLVFMLQVIKASEGLLKEAMSFEPETDFDIELKSYYESHFVEEEGHYDWLKADLEGNGVDITEYPLIRKAVEMAGTQYYLIKHEHPVSLLGYMSVLEGFPMSEEKLEMLERAHGKSLLKTLRYHVENDIEHRKHLFEIVDHVPEELKVYVRQSAIQAAIYISEITHEWVNGR